jgi:hypothetical protein
MFLDIGPNGQEAAFCGQGHWSRFEQFHAEGLIVVSHRLRFKDLVLHASGERKGDQRVRIQVVHHLQNAISWHMLEKIELGYLLLFLLCTFLHFFSRRFHLSLNTVLLLKLALKIGYEFFREFRFLDDGFDEGGWIFEIVGDTGDAVGPAVIELAELVEDAYGVTAEVAVGLA